MNVFLDIPDGFYAVKDHELYKIELPIADFPNARRIKIPKVEIQGMYDKRLELQKGNNKT